MESRVSNQQNRQNVTLDDVSTLSLLNANKQLAMVLNEIEDLDERIRNAVRHVIASKPPTIRMDLASVERAVHKELYPLVAKWRQAGDDVLAQSTVDAFRTVIEDELKQLNTTVSSALIGIQEQVDATNVTINAMRKSNQLFVKTKTTFLTNGWMMLVFGLVISTCLYVFGRGFFGLTGLSAIGSAIGDMMTVDNGVGMILLGAVIGIVYMGVLFGLVLAVLWGMMRVIDAWQARH